MAATTAKPTFMVRWTLEENERNLRKLFFAAAVDVPDQTLSNLAQPLVRIALKLLELFRAHRAAHAGGAAYAYVPPDDAQHDEWMLNEQDLVDATAELKAELSTQYVKDKIDATTGAASAANATKRAYKRRMLLQKVNSVMRNGLLKAIRGKTLLSVSHLENKDYVTAEIENFDAIASTQETRLVSLTCVRLIIAIFKVMAKRGSGKSSFQDLCALPNPSKDSWPSLEKRLLEI
jgi:hypothetical protein